MLVLDAFHRGLRRQPGAVAGQWEETGKETFARRRAGLTPETPVKSVKD